MFRIDIYHHIESEGATRTLDHILARLTELGVFMATVAEQIKKLTADFDAETTAVAARIDALLAAIAGGSVSQADLDAFQAISDRLKVLGTDPNNPIPPVVP